MNQIHIQKKEEQENLDNNSKFKIAVIIGPEGGISTEEVELLQKNGAKSITLGKRILRTETVALNVLSVIMYELENQEEMMKKIGKGGEYNEILV